MNDLVEMLANPTMDLSYHRPELAIPMISSVLALMLLLFYLIISKQRSNKNLNKIAPKPAGAFPIIGHLILLGRQSTPLARTLGALADKYGPIFAVRLGMREAVVISSQEAIKECFTKNDNFLASRPKSTLGKYIGYDHKAFGFAPYDSCWRSTRKLAMFQLLSNERLRTLRHLQVTEVSELVKDLHVFCKHKEIPTKVVLNDWIQRTTLNIITKIIAGKKYFSNPGSSHVNDGLEAKRVGQIVKDVMYTAGVFVPSDFIPFLGFLDFLLPQVKFIKRVAREIDSLVKSWVDEHQLERLTGDSNNNNKDFIHVMLSQVKDDVSSFGHSRETVIRALAQNLILAATESQAITMTWVMSNLLNNKNVLKLAQEELDGKVGRERWVEDSDINNLVYLKAIIKETFRLYPAAPLLFPRESTEDCTISGYQVKKGTFLFFNVWKLHRDPNVWVNPEVFLPERFLTSHANVDVIGQDFELIPFGSGRRACPGIAFALPVVQLTIARLIQGFEFTMPFNNPVDMTEGLGISLPRATDLEVMIKPRLSPGMYC